MKQHISMLTALGIIIPMAYALIMNIIPITNIKNYEDKVIDVLICDYQAKLNLEIEKELDVINTKEEKQNTREKLINQLQDKIDKKDIDNLNMLQEKTKNYISYIFIYFFGAFLIYVVIIMCVIVKCIKLNSKVLFYEYSEMILDEVAKEKLQKKKNVLKI